MNPPVTDDPNVPARFADWDDAIDEYANFRLEVAGKH
jgi:hypothetical protein